MDKTQEEVIYQRSYRAYYENEKQRVIEKVENPYNRQRLLEFHGALFARGAKERRVTKVSYQVRYLLGLNSRPINTWTCQDIEALVGVVNQRKDLMESTKKDYVICLKEFFKWFKKQDPRVKSKNGKAQDVATELYEYVLEELSSSFKREIIDRTAIIEDEDLQLLLTKGFEGVGNSARDKAFISVLHESGARAAEILSLKIKNIKLEDRTALLSLFGKTGRRNVILVSSVPYLFAWFNQHPNPDKESPVWVSLRQRTKCNIMTYAAAKDIIIDAFKRSGLRKKCNLHWFRHSRASLLADHLSESQLRSYMGWTGSSRMVGVYVHTNNKSSNDAIKTLHGLATEKPIMPITTPKVCPTCGGINEPTASFCFRCGAPQSITIALKHNTTISEQNEATIKRVLEIMQDPALLAKFQEVLKRDSFMSTSTPIVDKKGDVNE